MFDFTEPIAEDVIEIGPVRGDIESNDAVPGIDQIPDQICPDEASGSGDQHIHQAFLPADGIGFGAFT